MGYHYFGKCPLGQHSRVISTLGLVVPFMFEVQAAYEERVIWLHVMRSFGQHAVPMLACPSGLVRLVLEAVGEP